MGNSDVVKEIEGSSATAPSAAAAYRRWWWQMMVKGDTGQAPSSIYLLFFLLLPPASSSSSSSSSSSNSFFPPRFIALCAARPPFANPQRAIDPFVHFSHRRRSTGSPLIRSWTPVESHWTTGGRGRPPPRTPPSGQSRRPIGVGCRVQRHLAAASSNSTEGWSIERSPSREMEPAKKNNNNNKKKKKKKKKINERGTNKTKAEQKEAKQKRNETKQKKMEVIGSNFFRKNGKDCGTSSSVAVRRLSAGLWIISSG